MLAVTTFLIIYSTSITVCFLVLAVVMWFMIKEERGLVRKSVEKILITAPEPLDREQLLRIVRRMND